MANETVTLTNKGQVVIPKHIRKALHWESGAELVIETTEGGLLLRPTGAKRKLRLEDLRGFLKHEGPPRSTEELCKPVDYRADWEASEQGGK